MLNAASAGTSVSWYKPYSRRAPANPNACTKPSTKNRGRLDRGEFGLAAAGWPRDDAEAAALETKLRKLSPMTIEKAARFPSGWLVVVLLAGNGALWAVMFFGTLAHLQALAGGAAPHSTSGRWATVMEEARSLLAQKSGMTAHVENVSVGHSVSLLRWR